MRGMESANRRLSRAVCGRSCGVFGRSVDAGAVDGRAARACPRVLYGAVLGLWSLTGDGASFKAASAASVAADVRWKKLTGIFGQPFHLTCSSAAPASPALRGLLAFLWSRIACADGESSEDWLRLRISLLVSYMPLARGLEQKELALASCGIEVPKRALVVIQHRLRPHCRLSSCTRRWEHSYARRSHNHARVNAAASCVGVEVGVRVGR